MKYKRTKQQQLPSWKERDADKLQSVTPVEELVYGNSPVELTVKEHEQMLKQIRSCPHVDGGMPVEVLMSYAEHMAKLNRYERRVFAMRIFSKQPPPSSNIDPCPAALINRVLQTIPPHLKVSAKKRLQLG